MDEIKVVICDDAVHICKSFGMILENSDGIAFCGEAHGASECILMLREVKPNILLLDIQMECETAGIDILPEIRKELPDIKIIMLTGYDDEDYVFQAIAGGANDYFLKSLPSDELINTIKSVYRGHSSIRPEIAQKLAKAAMFHRGIQESFAEIMKQFKKLSASEFDLLYDVYLGKSYKQIAKERFVEEESIRSMASRVIKKLGAANIKELIKWLKKLQVFEK